MNKIIFWGMADRLGRLKPIPPALISMPSGDGPELEAAEAVNDYDKGTPVHDAGDVLFDNSHVCPYLLFSGKQGERVSSGHKTTALSEVSRLPGSHVNGISPKHVSSTSEEGAGVSLAVDESLPSFSSPQRCTNMNKSAVRIAPAPVAVANRFVSENELQEMERLDKINLRKIRKREAAFKSNEKRKERQGLARLSKSKL